MKLKTTEDALRYWLSTNKKECRTADDAEYARSAHDALEAHRLKRELREWREYVSAFTSIDLVGIQKMIDSILDGGQNEQ